MKDLPVLENEFVKLTPPVLTPENIKLYSGWLEEPKIIRGTGQLKKLSEKEIAELLTQWREDPLKLHWLIYLKKGEGQIPVGDLNLDIITKDNEKEYSEFSADPKFNSIFPKAGIGIMISSSYERLKIGKSVTQFAIEQGFNRMGLNAIYASIYSDNQGSLNLFEKVGFRKIANSIEERTGRDEWVLRLEKN